MGRGGLRDPCGFDEDNYIIQQLAGMGLLLSSGAGLGHPLLFFAIRAFDSG